MAPEVGVWGPAGTAAFSVADDGTLAFVAGLRGGRREIVWMDRSGKRLSVVTQKPDAIFGPALSPDGGTLAFGIGDVSAGQADIWIQDLQRATLPSKFTFGPRTNAYPVWSPDGSQIVFASFPGGGGASFHLEKKTIRGATSNEEIVLTDAAANTVATDWSPDGHYVVYSATDTKTNDDLWLLPMSGDRKPFPLLHSASNELLGQFSPDGIGWRMCQTCPARIKSTFRRFPLTDGGRFR